MQTTTNDTTIGELLQKALGELAQIAPDKFEVNSEWPRRALVNLGTPEAKQFVISTRDGKANNWTRLDALIKQWLLKDCCCFKIESTPKYFCVQIWASLGVNCSIQISETRSDETLAWVCAYTTYLKIKKALAASSSVLEPPDRTPSEEHENA